jgi:hypothetical protein
MRLVSGLRAWLAAALLACAASVAAQAPAGAGFTPLARSALVSAEAARAADALTLRLRAVRAEQALTVSDLAVAIDGRSYAAERRPDGTWTVSLAGLPAHSPGRLELVVAHDGLREVLNGTLPAAPAAPGAALTGAANALREHKQLAWWILNVVVVLIGVLALSRRMS